MSPGRIALFLSALGVACFIVAGRYAKAAESEPAPRPWLLWEWSPERAMPKVRGNYTNRTACELDMTQLTMVSTRATRLTCVKMEEKR